MAFQAGCPACGAQILFKTSSSVVVVCDYCHSVVARTDRALEDLGKVSDVSESGSPLEVGLKGAVRGVGFELTGRAQLGHWAGGTWDEWYAAFADGRWGWLAEAQGRFYLTFQRDVPDPQRIPPFEAVRLGEVVEEIPAKVPLVVAEKGEARMMAAEGEIPYRLVPGETYPYADLSGREGVFGTIDYGEQPPLVFVGREVTLEELGIQATGRAREREARTVAAAQLSCPNCGGPLELRAPDRAERVTCPNCGSLLDINHGQLRYLKALEPKGFGLSIPLGGQAEFEGQPFTGIGFVVRSVEFEGVRYFWQEYLLYNPQVGFRWLVESDGHWSYVRAVPPGEVTEDTRAHYGGKSFKVFQDAVARVEYVQGEFYWKVEAGELARAVDYVNAPEMLSKEISGSTVLAGKKQKERFVEGGEINWSHGTYVPVKEIERKFNVDLPSPTTVAPNQPFAHAGIYRYWVVLAFVTLLVGMAAMVTGSRARIFEQTYTLRPQPTPTPAPILSIGPPPLPSAGADALAAYEKLKATVAEANTASAATQDSANTQVIFSEQPFALRARQNVRVMGRANVDNNWLYVAGDLINEETGLVQQFELPIEEYHGVEDGEAWSEGGQQDTVYISSLPAGNYTLRLEAQWEKWNQGVPPQLTVRVEQGVPRVINLILALVLLSALPALVLWRHFRFERRRWADSSFNPYDAGGDDDGDEE